MRGGPVYGRMGKYRHVSDLSTFASGLERRINGKLHLHPLRPGETAEPPAPAEPYVGTFDELGRPLIEWRTLLAATIDAQRKGFSTVELEGRPGQFIEIRFGATVLAMVSFDDAFEAAKERGDVVVRDNVVFVRVDGGPVLN